MPNKVQILRSPIPGNRPTGRDPGELYVNFPDGVLGYVDATGQPVDLGGAPPPYDLPPATETTLGGVTVDGTTITVTLAGEISAAASAPYVLPPATDTDLGGVIVDGVTISAAGDGTITADGCLALTGGDLTGPVTGTTVDLTGGIDCVGETVVNASGATPYTQTSEAGSANFIVNKAATGGHLAKLAGMRDGVMRWDVALGNSTAEGGGNGGSGFAIANFSDAGVQLGQPMQISRAQGATTFSMPISETSDVRLKDNVEAVTGALDIIGALQGVYYNRKGVENRRFVGLVAQDVQAVLPEVVTEAENWPTPQSEGQFAGDALPLGVAYGNVVAVLIEAVKELTARLAALEGAPITALASGPDITVNTVKVQPRTPPKRTKGNGHRPQPQPQP